MTSVPRGPDEAGAGAPLAFDPAPVPAAAVDAPPRPAAFAPSAGRRFNTRCDALGENTNDWTSCHDCTAPVARFRNSTRSGGTGGVVAAPRPPCAPGAGVAPCGPGGVVPGVVGVVGDGAPGGTLGSGAGTAGSAGVPLPRPPRPRPPRPPDGSTV